MNLSTSSSESSSESSSKSSSKLYVSLIFGMLMLLAYNLFLHVATPTITEFQNQWIRNFARAEGYIYLDLAPEVVVVGSSMAARLDAETIYPGARNLSFSSTGSLTGLEVIERSGHVPKMVLIEANKIELDIDSEMINSLFTPVLWKFKRQLRFLQYQYQPGNILMTWITNKFGKSTSAKAKKKPTEKTLQARIKLHVQDNSDDTPVREADFTKLQLTLSSLASQGTQVVFFRMPVAPELLTSARYQLSDERLSQEFGDYQYFSMSPEEAAQYQTNDGQHLNITSAQAFSEVLARYTQSLLR